MTTDTLVDFESSELGPAAQLLGLAATEHTSAPVSTASNDADLRARMLARRRAYCVEKAHLIIPSNGSNKLRRRTMVASVLGCGGILLGSGWWSQANARQIDRNRNYAMELLSGSQAIFCEDSELLNAQSSMAEKQLPDEPLWVLDQADWKSLYAVNRATQSLSCVRIGQLDLAKVSLESSRRMIDEIAETDVQPEVHLLTELTLAKAVFDLMQGLGSQGRLGTLNREMVEVADDAFIKSRNHLEMKASESLDWKLLLVAIELEHLRLWIKCKLRPIDTAVAEDIRQLLDVSYRRLKSIPEPLRASLWWTLRMRHKGNEIVFRQRLATQDIINNGIPGEQLEDPRRQELLPSEHRALSLVLEGSTQQEDPYRHSLVFEYAIYLSNLADFIWTCRNDLAVVEAKLRTRSLNWLGRIPTRSRTLRHRENLAMNYGRRMYAKLRVWHDRDLTIQELNDLRSDALVLESQIGGLPAGRIGQLATRDRIIAGMLIGIPKETIKEYQSLKNYQPKSETEQRILENLERRLKESPFAQPRSEMSSEQA